MARGPGVLHHGGPWGYSEICPEFLQCGGGREGARRLADGAALDFVHVAHGLWAISGGEPLRCFALEVIRSGNTCCERPSLAGSGLDLECRVC